MQGIQDVLAAELGVRRDQVEAALRLFGEGGTVPFVARYRKEMTGGMTEVQLHALQDRHRYLTELEDRKAVILASIEEQGKLTDALRDQIAACTQKTELEDLYLPYRPKRRTRATIARERGLGPLAEWIQSHNAPESPRVDLNAEAARYVDAEKGVGTPADALQGASDILAESFAEDAALRAALRRLVTDHGTFAVRIGAEHAEGTTQYEMYRDFRVPVRSIAAHNMLAMRRGEAEGILLLTIEFDEEGAVEMLAGNVVRTGEPALAAFLKDAVADAYKRLMKHSIVGEVRLQKKEEADAVSVQTFAANLRDLLLASPAGMRPTLAIDPGFRTGCKAAVLDGTGRLLEHRTIYPHNGADARARAAEAVAELLRRHPVELIAVGNGTAGRETDAFVTEVLAGSKQKPVKVMVSEAGASVYSASPAAVEEFPDLDVTIRGAISIGRRLQDPLAELVRIDPKAIGVGQYQHDVDQGLLRQKLEETVESCVNYVGVDLNTASKELLGYVAGLTPSVAQNIVQRRNERGPFRSRRELMDVPRFGPKAFEQAAGFLRIRDGENPLDNTAVHPESYGIVAAMARDLGVPLERITQVPDRLRSLELKRYTTATVGEPTLRDILAELEKPGRDPRAQFTYATFRDDVQTIDDLQVGMVLEGVVTNVAEFGAFVDIGVHRDGLVHVSQLPGRRGRSPKDVVHVGQVVQVRVAEVNRTLKRISLSMRLQDEADDQPRKPRKAALPTPSYTLEDLKKKFNSR